MRFCDFHKRLSLADSWLRYLSSVGDSPSTSTLAKYMLLIAHTSKDKERILRTYEDLQKALGDNKLLDFPLLVSDVVQSLAATERWEEMLDVARSSEVHCSAAASAALIARLLECDRNAEAKELMPRVLHKDIGWGAFGPLSTVNYSQIPVELGR